MTRIFDPDIHYEPLLKLRGGCSCHIHPPCSACSEPPTEDELEELGIEPEDEEDPK